MIGILISLIIFALQFYLIFLSLGAKAAAIIVAVSASFPFLWGAPLFRARMGVKRISEYDREYAQLQPVIEQAKQNSFLLRHFPVKLFVSSDDFINAYAIGFNSITVTQGMVKSIDQFMRIAVISHELGHLEYGDNILIMTFSSVLAFTILTMTVFQFGMTVGLVLIVMVSFSIFGSGIGFGTGMVLKGFFGLFGKLCNLIKNLYYQVFQAIVLMISRHMEYRADKFSAELKPGNGKALQMFLNKYVQQQPRSILEVIYDTHPSSLKRINRLQKLNQKKQQLARK